MKTLGWLCVMGLWSWPLHAQDIPETPLRAVYETRVANGRGKTQTRRWAFSRAGAMLEYYDYTNDVTERWRRDRRANVSFVRIFHREHTAVRYMPGDLATFHVTMDWSRLAHVIEPPSREQLRVGLMTEVLGQRAQRFRNASMEASWIEALGIPGFLRAHIAGRDVSVKLVELSLAQPSPTELRMRQVDITDFGDMEEDAFVQRHHADRLPDYPVFGSR